MQIRLNFIAGGVRINTSRIILNATNNYLSCVNVIIDEEATGINCSGRVEINAIVDTGNKRLSIRIQQQSIKIECKDA